MAYHSVIGLLTNSVQTNSAFTDFFHLLLCIMADSNYFQMYNRDRNSGKNLLDHIRDGHLSCSFFIKLFNLILLNSFGFTGFWVFEECQ